MATYTFITDYQGGTYISQHAADDLSAACGLWKAHVADGDYIPDLDARQFTKAFEADIDELPPVAIDEVRNVWLFQLLLNDDLLNVHIIQTDLSVIEPSIKTQASSASA